MYKNHTISVIIPAYNEETTIAAVIEDFMDQGIVEEILVVDNNSKDQTAKVSKEAGATVITETKQGYGFALRAGLDAAKGDILILTEADGSFRASDLNKFLAYIEDADMVIGTRTTKQMVEQGARMNLVIRLANVAWAKFLQALWFLHNETRFTDVGCTYRAIWRDTYLQIRSALMASGPDFSPEMMAVGLHQRIRIVEIPVKYFQRTGGVSKHSVSYFHLSKTAMKMLRTVLARKWEQM